jgi:predicted nucleic acid-binding protein
MSGYGSVLSVFWDADSLFRLASTKLPEERSATLTILRLAMLGLLISVTSIDALVEARRSLRNVYGKEKGRRFIRRLRQMVRQHFQVVPTPLPDQVQVALSEVSDPADALILAACKGANCLVLLTYNTRHFLQAKRVRVLTPRNFLERLRRALWEGFR